MRSSDTRIEGSAEYFGSFAGYNYGYITNCEIHDTDIVWNDQKLQKEEENRHTLAESQGRMMQELFLPIAKIRQMQRLVCCQTISGIPHRRFILEAFQKQFRKNSEESWKMEKSATSTRSDVQSIGRLYADESTGRDDKQTQRVRMRLPL